MGTCTVYLVSKFGMAVMWSCSCPRFRLSLFCPLCKATLVASGPAHPSPFTNSSVPMKLHWGIVSEVEEKGGRQGTKFSTMPKPIQAGLCQSTMCVQTIELNPTQCILRPYLGEAKYTLSYQRKWMSDWNSQFFCKCKHIYYAPPLQAVQIKIMAARAEK